jgi:3-deoxy-D-manno-octulosonic-acid transferase
MRPGYGTFIFLYHLLWSVGSMMVLPSALLMKSGRLRKRLALDLPAKPVRGGGIWLHALSVGEVISSIPLVNRLAERYPQKEIVLSAATSKGMAMALEKVRPEVRNVVVMPVDAWWAVRRIVDFVRPSVFILVETDIWPATLDYLRRRGIHRILVNGRVSPRTYAAYRRARPVARSMFESLSWCLMQSDLDRERLIRIGVDPAKVVRTGNIKFDQEWPPMDEAERVRRIEDLTFHPEDYIWVAGSTHEGEEETVLEVFKRLLPDHPRLRLIVAPRQVERAAAVRRLFENAGVPCALRTEMPWKGRPLKAVVLDTLGELGRFYGLGKAGFVGGSLVPFGGHNLLEPASFGCPVLFGPHTHNFVDMSESLVAAGGGWRVEDSDALLAAMNRLAADERLRTKMGERAREFVHDNRGALDRVLKVVEMSCLLTPAPWGEASDGRFPAPS